MKNGITALKQICRDGKISLAIITALALFAGVVGSQLSIALSLPRAGNDLSMDRVAHAQLYFKDTRTERRFHQTLAGEIASQTRIPKATAPYRPASTVVSHGATADLIPSVYTEASLFDVFTLPEWTSARATQLLDRAGTSLALISPRAARILQLDFDPSVTQAINVAGEICTVVGISRPEWRIPNGTDIIVIQRPPTGPAPEGRFLNFVVRFDDFAQFGAFKTEAEAVVARSAISAAMKEQITGIEVVPFKQFLMGGERARLIRGLEVSTIGFGCALLGTLAILALLRGKARELSTLIRISLGASRADLVRESLLRTAWYVVIAAPVAFAIALGYVYFLKSALSFGGGGMYWMVVTPTLGWLLGALALAATSIPLADALAIRRLSGSSLLVQARAGAPRLEGMLPDLVIVTQVALAILLIACCYTIAQFDSKRHLAARTLDRDSILFFKLSVSTAQASNVERQMALLSRIETGLREDLPGVAGITFARRSTYAAPPSESFNYRAVGGGAWDAPRTIPLDIVDTDYFNTIGAGVLSGRGFTPADHARAPRVAVVNAAFARQFSPDRSPIGGTVERANVTYEIVGVVPDLDMNGVQTPETPAPGIYFHMPQAWRLPYPVGIIRFEGEVPANAAALVRRSLARSAPDLVPYSFETLAASIDSQFVANRNLLNIMVSYGSIAVLATFLGLYAIVLYRVDSSTQSIAIRMALGGSAWQAFWATARRLFICAFGGVAVVCLIVAVMNGGGLRVGIGVIERLQWNATFTGIAIATVVVAAATFPALLKIRRVNIAALLAK